MEWKPKDIPKGGARKRVSRSPGARSFQRARSLTPNPRRTASETAALTGGLQLRTRCGGGDQVICR